MIKRSTMMSIRIDNNDLDNFEKNVIPAGKFKNVSECIRELAKIGLKVIEYQEMMKDPEKNLEFSKKMQEIIQTENFDQFTQTLSTEQLDGFLMFMQIEKEKRIEQKNLL